MKSGSVIAFTPKDIALPTAPGSASGRDVTGSIA